MFIGRCGGSSIEYVGKDWPPERIDLLSSIQYSSGLSVKCTTRGVELMSCDIHALRTPSKANGSLTDGNKTDLIYRLWLGPRVVLRAPLVSAAVRLTSACKMPLHLSIRAKKHAEGLRPRHHKIRGELLQGMSVVGRILPIKDRAEISEALKQREHTIANAPAPSNQTPENAAE